MGDGEQDIDDTGKPKGLDLEQLQTDHESRALFNLALGRGNESEGAKLKHNQHPSNVQEMVNMPRVLTCRGRH